MCKLRSKYLKFHRINFIKNIIVNKLYCCLNVGHLIQKLLRWNYAVLKLIIKEDVNEIIDFQIDI